MRWGNLKVDYHVHTAYSDDSVYPMEAVVSDAIARGFDEICFTDHVDYGVKKDWSEGNIEYRNGEPVANVDYPAYMAEASRLADRYSPQIALKLGLEFGVQSHTIPQYRELFRRYPFDFILLSVHQVGDQEFWTGDFQRGKSQDEYNREYYEEMLRIVQNFKDYSVLAHMDLIARYDPEGPYPFEKVKPLVEPILKTVIADGKGLEVNTSWKRYGLPDLTPSKDILKLYRQLGGQIITIGSDSHKPEHLGDQMEETKRQLRELGFTEFCTYERMKPIRHLLTID